MNRTTVRSQRRRYRRGEGAAAGTCGVVEVAVMLGTLHGVAGSRP